MDHQSRLAASLQALKLPLSEYRFSTLYLFRQAHDYSLISHEGWHCVAGIGYDDIHFLMPIHEPWLYPPSFFQKVADQLGILPFLFPIPEQWDAWASSFAKTYTLNDSDYVFRAEQLAFYPGRKLSRKRNLVAQFLHRYEPQVSQIRAEHAPQIENILEEWEANKDFEIGSDFEACQEAIQHIDSLHLRGWLVTVQNEPAAFMLGEKGNDNIFFLHFAKAKLSFKGIYPYLYQYIAKELLDEGVEEINFEQDLGLAGLRKGKNSYSPHLLLHKWRVLVSELR